MGLRLHVWVGLSVAALGASTACGDPCEKPGRICTVAGVPMTNGLNGDDLPGVDTWLYFPTALAWDDGLLIDDFNNMRIRRLEADGTLRTVLGNGYHANAIPGAAARETPLENPVDVAVLADGRVAVMELHSGRVLVVESTGTVAVLAGNAEIGAAGDGGPAVEASLSEAWGIAASPDGRLFIADTDNHCVRVVGPDGTIERVLGTGEPGLVDGPNGQIAAPQRVRWDGDGLLITDSGNHAIRRFDLNTGELTTLAGLGEDGASGDGGPANAAMLYAPASAIRGPDGAVWIADAGNHAIRRIDPDGTITTAFGGGASGYGGDEGPANEAAFAWPGDLAFGPDGALYIADTRNGIVRRVTPDASGHVDHGG